MPAPKKVEGKRGVRWRVRYDAPADPATGERRQRTATFRTRKEANDFLARVENDKRTQTYAEPAKMTVGELLDRWQAARRSEGRVRGATLRRHRSVIERHLRPRLDAVPLARFDDIAAQAFVDELTRARGAAIARTAAGLLSMIFARARMATCRAQSARERARPAPRAHDGGAHEHMERGRRAPLPD
jgi:hypothetical protein